MQNYKQSEINTEDYKQNTFTQHYNQLTQNFNQDDILQLNDTSNTSSSVESQNTEENYTPQQQKQHITKENRKNTEHQTTINNDKLTNGPVQVVPYCHQYPAEHLI